MPPIIPTRTVFTVSQFLDWQRSGTLVLKPVFQRREVWKKKAKSLLLDTVVKGLPMPIVFLRKRQNLETLSTVQEVVDGQQRLRTLFSYIDPKSLKDFDPEKDRFTVEKFHNPDLAGKTFRELPSGLKDDILSYEISTHVFPPQTSDEVVLRIFSRMNSTGLKLSHQEIRNAEFFGEFKSLSYDLAFDNLDKWRKFSVFNDDDFARMVEVESVSDYLIAIMRGVQGKSQPKISKFYEEYDDDLPAAGVLRDKFQRVLEEIDRVFGDGLRETSMRRQALFYSLFTASYDHVYGLKNDYKKSKSPRPLPASARQGLLKLNRSIEQGRLPEEVQDAMDKATADLGRRLTRHRHFMKALGLDPAS